MALAGAGNPVGGSNPAGTGTSLNYIGDHCYAYSGSVEIQTGDTDLLVFSTGNSYIVAKIQLDSTAGSGNNLDLTIKLNDQIISSNEISSDFQNYPAFAVPLELIIPSYSKIQITGSVATSAKNWTLVLTGRVYA